MNVVYYPSIFRIHLHFMQRLVFELSVEMLYNNSMRRLEFNHTNCWLVSALNEHLKVI